MQYNAFNQPIGNPVTDHPPAILPDASGFNGSSCLLERLDYANHFALICDCYLNHMDPQDWTYLPIDPPRDEQQVRSLVQQFTPANGLYCYVIMDPQRQSVLGTFCLMRADTTNRSIEMGWVIYSNRLKRSKMATEAQFLLMQYVFDQLRFRRYEWKCDALNAPSRNAAQRLGFQHEGTFRNAVVYKGRNRDTTWFSIIEDDWATIKTALQRYLAPTNFDFQHIQLRPLRAFLK